MRHSRWKLAGVAILVAALGGTGLVFQRHRQRQQFRSRLNEAIELLRTNHTSEARRAFQALEQERPDDPEVLYHSGLGEYVRGNLNAAAKTWSRVPLDAAQGGLAGYYRARIAIPRGRFVEAEDLLTASLRQQGHHADDARWELVKLLRVQGRFVEARAIFVQGIRQDLEIPGMIRLLYSLDVDPVPVERLRVSLEAAFQQSPRDDRVWLARGHLALAQGNLTESDRWLTDCEQRRPDDPAVARLRLGWGMASGRADDARAAMKRIPADPNDPETEPRVLELAAWLARQTSGHAAERQLLEQMLLLRPLDSRALERLAEIAAEDQKPDLVASYRKTRQVVDPLRKRYEALLGAAKPSSDLAELETLSRRLGRETDSRLWRALLDLQVGKTPPAASASIQPVEFDPSRAPTLAELVARHLTAPTGNALAESSRKEPSPAEGEAIAPLPRFTDDAATKGLVFTHHNGDTGKRLIPPVTGAGGVGLLDFDGDGWTDVFAVQSGPFPFDPRHPHDGDRLFRNRGDGTWEDATMSSGLSAMPKGYGHGVAVGDYDSDGRPDLFVTRWRSYALYHNRGDGTFEDRTESAGLCGDRDWPTSAAFADFDNDGDLDLYVCHYMLWDEADPRVCFDPDHPEVFHCTPINFPALGDHIFRNDQGRFVDVTEAAGIRDTDGRGLGVIAADVNEDGLIDLFVANDMSANYLFLNRGGFRFEEAAQIAGVAGNASGGYQAGMGVACGDLNRDGRPDLVVTNFYNEGTTYFENLGNELFADRSDQLGIRGPSRYLLGFGVAFLDAANDGWLDLMSANGHVNDGRPSYPWKMPVQLLSNGRGGRMHDVSRRAGDPFQVDRLGRGLAVGDLDNDGRLDALILSQNEPLAYFHNQSKDTGHFLRLRLVGRESNRDGVGARIRIQAGQQRWFAQRTSGGSYQSAPDPRLQVGLGLETRIDELEVTWPSGRRDRHTGLVADREYMVTEGGTAVPRTELPR